MAGRDILYRFDDALHTARNGAGAQARHAQLMLSQQAAKQQ